MGYFSDVLPTWLNSSYRRAGVTCRQMTRLGRPRADHGAAPRASPPLPPQEQTREAAGRAGTPRPHISARPAEGARGARAAGQAPQTLLQVRQKGCGGVGVIPLPHSGGAMRAFSL